MTSSVTFEITYYMTYSNVICHVICNFMLYYNMTFDMTLIMKSYEMTESEYQYAIHFHIKLNKLGLGCAMLRISGGLLYLVRN